MIKTLMLSHASAAAFALMAPPADGAGGAPTPKTADQVKPAEPSRDPVPNATGAAPKTDPNPPTKAADAEKAEKGRIYMVWAQPGHEKLGIGQLISIPKAAGELLRSAGRARYASPAEVKAGKDQALNVDGV